MSSDAAAQPGVESELTAKFREFIRTYYDNRDGQPSRISRLVERYPSEQKAFIIDWPDLFQYEMSLAEDLLEQPETIQKHAKQALIEYDLPVDVDLSGVEVRFAELPPEAERDIGTFGTDDEDGLRKITGQVTKKSAKRIKVETAAFECERCGDIQHIPQNGPRQEPHECMACERQGPFTLDASRSERVNYQRLRVQLPPEKAQGMGAEHIDVHVEADLVNKVEVGDRATATVIPRTHEVDDEDMLVLDWHAETNHIEAEDAALDEIDYSAEREQIKELAAGDDPFSTLINSIKPTHYGNEDAKLAIGLQLFGGVRKVNDDGSTMRGTPHVLLIGDPGTDKTGLLDYAAELAPRSVFTSGEGSSGVGLTAAVVNDDFSPHPTLEAGAMVLANDGLVALDEFDKLDEQQQTAMNEALSKQTVSISKWGINATLNARTTLLAAANPEHGRFDPYAPPAKELNLDPTLLSRFDLMFIIKDEPNEERDLEIAEHINTAAYVGAKKAKGEAVESDAEAAMAPDVEPDLLRKWIAYARDTCEPVLTEETREYIKRQYVDLRMASGDDDAVPVTARKIEAIHRLSEASARVRLSDTVELEDAQRAVSVVKDCLKEVGIDPETGEFDADVIETGQSKTQRQRKKTVLGLIKSNQGETEYGAPLDILVEEAQAVGITEGKFHHELNEFKENGKVYEPADEHYRLTKDL